MTDITNISEETFKASAVQDGDDIVLRLTGNADVVAKRHLDSLLNTVHDHARQRGIGRVYVDIRQLAFMNSSCFKDLISWLDKVREARERYYVTFQSSSSRHWQKRSLHALSCFAPDLVAIESS
jgi:hypothetical protein